MRESSSKEAKVSCETVLSILPLWPYAEAPLALEKMRLAVEHIPYSSIDKTTKVTVRTSPNAMIVITCSSVFGLHNCCHCLLGDRSKDTIPGETQLVTYGRSDVQNPGKSTPIRDQPVWKFHCIAQVLTSGTLCHPLHMYNITVILIAVVSDIPFRQYCNHCTIEVYKPDRKAFLSLLVLLSYPCVCTSRPYIETTSPCDTGHMLSDK